MKKKKFDPIVAGLHALVFAILAALGINFGFVADKWLTPVFPDWPWVAFILSLFMAGFVIFGSYALFLKTEQIAQAIRRSDEHWGLKLLRMIALLCLNGIFIGVEVAGLLYRSNYLANVGKIDLLYIGISLAFVPALIGLVLEPLIRKPAEVLADEFESSVLQETYNQLLNQPLHKQRQALAEGADTVIEDLEEEQIAAEEEKGARRKNREARRKEFTRQLLPGKKDTGSNGDFREARR